MREKDTVRNSDRRIGLADVLAAVAAVLLGVQALNYIVALVSNFSATFMVFGLQAGNNAIAGVLGVLLLLAFVLVLTLLSGFPSIRLIQSMVGKMFPPSKAQKNPEWILVMAVLLLLVEVVLWILTLINPLTHIPYFGSVLVLMGSKAAKGIVSSVVVVVLLYAAHVVSKNK